MQNNLGAEGIGHFSRGPPMLKEISIHVAAVHELERRLKPGWLTTHRMVS
jgi:hypothetical protein